jgi:hypothetical protein
MIYNGGSFHTVVDPCNMNTAKKNDLNIYSDCTKHNIKIILKNVQRMEENRIPKKVLYTNFGTRLRGRPRNRWHNEVREDGRIVGGEGWQEKVMTERNGRSSRERQGIIAFCTCQWHR